MRLRAALRVLSTMMTPVWVRIHDWMLADGEPPRPSSGSVLRQMGVRVRGALDAVDSVGEDAIVPTQGQQGVDSPPSVYTLTGLASRARDVRTTAGEYEAGQCACAEFLLTVGPLCVAVRLDGSVAALTGHSRVQVTGSLELIAEHEYDAFELADTRADWLVRRVSESSDNGIAVDIDAS